MNLFSGLISSDRRAMAVLGVTVLVVRLAFAWGVSPFLAQHGIEADDWPDSYALFSENLVGGHGFAVKPGTASVMRGPVQPLLGALVFQIFGIRNLAGVQVCHALLDSVTAVLVFAIGRRAFGPTAGFVAAVMFAFYPLSIWYSGKMSMVPLLTMLYCLLCWVVLRIIEGLSVARSIAVGVVLGVTTLTLPITLLFPPFLLALWLAMRLGRGRALRHWIIVCAVMAAILLPWTIRNYRVSDRFIPVSAGGGYAFLFGDLFVERFDGFSPYSDEYPDEHALQQVENERVVTLLPPDLAARFWHLDFEPEASQIFDRHAAQSIVERPFKFVRKMAIQTVTFWYLGNNRTKTFAILVVQLVCVIPWFVAGVYLSGKRRIAAALPLLLLIVYLNLTYAATIANARHGMPAMPIAIIFGAFALCELVRRPASAHPASAGPSHSISST
jgi:4-amino-4-deoxy-L-arabinose transferase-like glycosyltransferase